MRRLGIDGSTESPAGGLIEKRNGQPTGYFEENAFIEYQKKIPLPGVERLSAAFERAQKIYAENGITTIQDGMIVREMSGIYQMLMGGGRQKLDLVAYAGPDDYLELKRELFDSSEGDANQIRQGGSDGYTNHIRLGGVKIFLDGSPQGRTAWMREPYLPDSSGVNDYRGYGTMTDDEVISAMSFAAEQKTQLLATATATPPPSSSCAVTRSYCVNHPVIRGLPLCDQYTVSSWGATSLRAPRSLE